MKLKKIWMTKMHISSILFYVGASEVVLSLLLLNLIPCLRTSNVIVTSMFILNVLPLVWYACVSHRQSPLRLILLLYILLRIIMFLYNRNVLLSFDNITHQMSREYSIIALFYNLVRIFLSIKIMRLIKSGSAIWWLLLVLLLNIVVECIPSTTCHYYLYCHSIYIPIVRDLIRDILVMVLYVLIGRQLSLCKLSK